MLKMGFRVRLREVDNLQVMVKGTFGAVDDRDFAVGGDDEEDNGAEGSPQGLVVRSRKIEFDLRQINRDSRDRRLREESS